MSTRFLPRRLTVLMTSLATLTTGSAATQQFTNSDSTASDSTRDSGGSMAGLSVRALVPFSDESRSNDQLYALVFRSRGTTHSDSTPRVIGAAGEFGAHILLSPDISGILPYGEFGLEARVGPFYALADAGAMFLIGAVGIIPLPIFYARSALGLSFGDREKMVIQIEIGSYVPLAQVDPISYLGASMMVK